MPVTFAAIRKIALALDRVEETTSYGTPAFKLRGTMLARLRPDLDALVVHMPIQDRQELIAADPETYFITDHYVEYPYVLVRLSRVHADAIGDLLRLACRTAAATAKAKAAAKSKRRRPSR